MIFAQYVCMCPLIHNVNISIGIIDIIKLNVNILRRFHIPSLISGSHKHWLENQVGLCRYFNLIISNHWYLFFTKNSKLLSKFTISINIIRTLIRTYFKSKDRFYLEFIQIQFHFYYFFMFLFLFTNFVIKWK